MANVINITAYRLERASPDALTNQIVWGYPVDIAVSTIDKVVPVNVLNAEDVNGLPWLYSKIVKKQFGTDQEIYCMNSVSDLLNKMNA